MAVGLTDADSGDDVTIYEIIISSKKTVQIVFGHNSASNWNIFHNMKKILTSREINNVYETAFTEVLRVVHSIVRM